MNNDSFLNNHQDSIYTNQDIMVFLDDSTQPLLNVLGAEPMPSSTSSQSEIPNVFLIPETQTIVRDCNDNVQTKMTCIKESDLSQNVTLGPSSSHIANTGTEYVSSFQIINNLSQNIVLGSTSNYNGNTDFVNSTQIANTVDMDNQQLILTENDLDALASCLFPQQNINGMTPAETNGAGLEESLYTSSHPQQSFVSNVGLSVNCTTASTCPNKKSTKVDDSWPTDQKKKRLKPESTRKQALSEIFDNMDSDALPKHILLPLPTFCNCQVTEEIPYGNAEQCLKKYNKVIVLRHVGRVILNGVELISFKRRDTVVVSREQMECEQMYAKKKNYVQQVMDVCCGKFLSMVDILTQDEHDYLKQKNIVSKRSSRKVAFSIGLACWILDFINDQKTTPYAKILGHMCENPRNILMISKNQIRSKKTDDADKSALALSTILIENFEDEIDNEFLIVELGRVLVNVTCLAAFQVHQVNKCYVNCHQIISLLLDISADEFYDIVQKRNCQLVPMPEKISDHFQALDSSLPAGFFDSQWIEINEVSRICCFWMGRRGDDVANCSLLSNLAHNKVVYIFKKKTKGLNYPVTYPQLTMRKNRTGKTPQSLPQSPVSAAMLTSARVIFEDVCTKNFSDSELSGMKVCEKNNQQTQNEQPLDQLNQTVSGTDRSSPKSACKRKLHHSGEIQIKYATRNKLSPNVKKPKVIVEYSLKDIMSNSQCSETPQEPSEAEKIRQNILPVTSSTGTVETSKDITVDSTIDQTTALELLPASKCLEFQKTSPKALFNNSHDEVVANNRREAIECAPLFPSDNLMKRDMNISPKINQKSPALKLQNTKLQSPVLKLVETANRASSPTAKDMLEVHSSCEEVKLAQSDFNTVSLESFEESFGPVVHKNNENTTKTSAHDTGLVNTIPSKDIPESVNSEKEFSVPENKNDSPKSYPQFPFNGGNDTIICCDPENVTATEPDELKSSTSSELVQTENGSKASLSEKTLSAILQAQSLLKDLIFTRSNIQTVTERFKMNVMLKGGVRDLFLKSGSGNTQKLKHQLLKLIHKLVVNIQHVNKLQKEHTILKSTPDDCTKQQNVCEGNFKSMRESPLSKTNVPKQVDTSQTSSPSYRNKHSQYYHSYTQLKVPDLLSSNRQSDAHITPVSDTPDFHKNPQCPELNQGSILNLSEPNLQSLDNTNISSSSTELEAEHLNQNTQNTSSQPSLVHLDSPTQLFINSSNTESFTPAAPLGTNICPENCSSTAKATQALEMNSSDPKTSDFVCGNSNSIVPTAFKEWRDSTAAPFSTEHSDITAFSTASVSAESAFSNQLLVSTPSTSKLLVSTPSTSKSVVSTDAAFAASQSTVPGSSVQTFTGKSSNAFTIPYQADQSIQNSQVLQDCSAASLNKEELRSSGGCTPALLHQTGPHQPKHCNQNLDILAQDNSLPPSVKCRLSNNSISPLLHSPSPPVQSTLNSSSSTEGLSTAPSTILRSSYNSTNSQLLPTNQSHQDSQTGDSTTTPHMETTIPYHEDGTPVDMASTRCNSKTGNKSIQKKSRKSEDDVSDLVKQHSCLSEILSRPPKNNITIKFEPVSALTVSSGNQGSEKRTPKKPRRFSPPPVTSKKILGKKKICDKGSVPCKQNVTTPRKGSAKIPSVQYIYVSPKYVVENKTSTTDNQDIVQKKSYNRTLTISKLLEQKEKSEQPPKKTNIKYVTYAESRLV